MKCVLCLGKDSLFIYRGFSLCETCLIESVRDEIKKIKKDKYINPITECGKNFNKMADKEVKRKKVWIDEIKKFFTKNETNL